MIIKITKFFKSQLTNKADIKKILLIKIFAIKFLQATAVTLMRQTEVAPGVVEGVCKGINSIDDKLHLRLLNVPI